MRTRALLAGVAAALLVGAIALLPPPPVEAQLVPQDGGRLAGLRWTFVRVRYTAGRPSGTVLRQSLEPGIAVRPGLPITLLVGDGSAS